MKTFIAVTILSTLFLGSAFAQSSNQSHDAHRFVNNATAFPHVEAARHEQPRIKINKTSAVSFSEMNEHERAIIAHSFMNNSTSYAHQKMIEAHKKKLNESEANAETSSFSELNAGEKAALVHERVNNAGAEAHQMQARILREGYESKG
ncbi:copper resistance protein [Cronobacter sakazakii]|uniref:copper resistance protein n=1 Tax=Enterobacteriaceae TaxID=543 RepID=UPI0012394702|nr:MULTISPECIES: copper resistance protein [Enterobacteriaceae]EKM0364709.1 copper resistance protein [Cronobacter turicensis]ELQ6141388.1 copper resistance protein [Cronobacter sakazakii]ELY4512600.1 copper resistance protein [Cronobacter dublinensis]HAT7661894.1 copper resistance protein [Enterobacter hormaechei subsp. steigerwaltii]ELY3539529.1 copper resistance protein [Cronobacter sakazakii]